MTPTDRIEEIRAKGDSKDFYDCNFLLTQLDLRTGELKEANGLLLDSSIAFSGSSDGVTKRIYEYLISQKLINP